jgi:carbon monoxide dehydrogenase subunit G
MVTIEKSFTIHRPLEDVFSYMTRFENDKDWRGEVVDIRRTTPVNRGIGERYEQLIDVGGRQVQADFEVTEYENNRRIGFRGTSGDLNARATYDFSAEGAATRVDVKAEIDVSGSLDATEPYVRQVVQRVGNEDFDRLRRRLEANPKGGA